MKHTFKLNTLTVAIISSFVISNAYAQEDIQKPQEETSISEQVKSKKAKADLEVIEVQGFRGSILRSLNAKRFAEGVSDAIHAEDIGKSTDQNIGDALSRITGVTVQEENGEGTRITIRGASPRLNQISLNGVQLTSGVSGDVDNPVSDQSVDLSAFSSDILASIEVEKTAAADQDEGSLGANVVLRTVKPLSLSKPRRIVEVQGRYNDYSEESDRKLSFTVSDKFFDDTFGIIFTASDETQNTRSDRARHTYLNTGAPLRDRGATDADTGLLVRLPVDGAAPADFNAASEVLFMDTPHIVAISQSTFSTNLDKKDRQTANLGLQYRPFDSTDIQLDLSYSKQLSSQDQHSITVRHVPELSNNEGDPEHLWRTLDSETQTFTRVLSRSADGRLGRNLVDLENENKVASLRLEQEFTDNLRMSLRGGYSQTKNNTLDNANLSTATFRTVPGALVQGIDVALLEPGGYDCTTGSCELFTATTPLQFAPGQSNNSDSIATGRFNPLDPNAMHLGNLRFRDNDAIDTNKSVFVDFDYDVELGPITQFEFGAKWSNRVKDVSSNNISVANNVTVFDDEGNPLSNDDLTGISFSQVLGSGAFPVNNLLEDIVPNRNAPFLAGWGLIDPVKTTQLALGQTDIRLTPDDSDSRVIEQDNVSLYLKANFEFFDGKLTGNIGGRYVKTDISANGGNKVDFHSSQNILDHWDLIVNKQLANESLAACAPGIEPLANGRGALQNDIIEGNCYDWMLTHAFNSRDSSTFQPTGDPANILQILQVDYSGDVPAVVYNNDTPENDLYTQRFARNHNTLRRWRDASTTVQTGIDLFGEENASKSYLRTFRVSGESDNSVFLPSLTLNYLLDEDTVVRMGLSKTMARPRFDSLRPTVSIVERTFVSNRTRGTANNVDLRPLTSTNIDFSYEWYFNDSGLLSAAVFYKDMKDFEQAIVENFYWKDIRTDYDLQELNKEELLIPIEGEQTPGNSGCLPNRLASFPTSNALRLESPLACDLLELTEIRNGQGTTTKGLELSYVQSYDFLPGLLSGLGVNANYTFAKSEDDPELSVTAGKFRESLPQPYTPRHSANFTVFWEKDDLELRLANRYNGVQLVNQNGITAEWKDHSSRWDFSLNYKINKTVSVNFHALNLTDDITRTFLTAVALPLNLNEIGAETIFLEEGNYLDGGVTASRESSRFKTGRLFRLGIRASF